MTFAARRIREQDVSIALPPEGICPSDRMYETHTLCPLNPEPAVIAGAFAREDGHFNFILCAAGNCRDTHERERQNSQK